MKKIFAIGIPTINRADLLNDVLRLYVDDFPDIKIIVVDNGKQDIFVHENIKVLQMSRNIGFTESCNIMLAEIYYSYQVDWASIINDDIYWGKKQQQVELFVEEKERDGENLIVTNFNWCNFLMPKRTFEKVGKWDSDNFFNYFSDNDYARRMAILGMNFLPSTFMNPTVYRESQSIKKDPSLNHTSFDESKRNYLAKWGGLPPNEKFTLPFNRK